MDLLRTAVVDITTLLATWHALKSAPFKADPAMHRKLRNHVRREIKRATFAYVDALARAEPGTVDDVLLTACRRAAEQQMTHAISQRELLADIMGSETGALDGFAATRQDLWRLANMTIHLRIGITTLAQSGDAADAKFTRALADRLRRRLRKALVAYVRTSLRAKVATGPLIATARGAALAQIGKRGAAQAERLSQIESGGDPAHTAIRSGVARPLLDLGLDWKRPESHPA
jgi:predicted PilT family ATPase